MKKFESEKLLERKLKTELEKQGGWCLKLLSNHISGLPDRLCLTKDGKAIFVEVKSTGFKPRKIQLFVHNKLKRMGFEVLIIDSTTGIKDFIKNYA